MSHAGASALSSRATTFRGSGALALAVSSMMMVAALLVVLATVVALRSSEGRAAHSLRALGEIEQLRTAIVQADTSQQNYILTGEGDYLAPYAASVERFGVHLAAIRSDFSEAPHQLHRLRRVEELSALKFDAVSRDMRLVKEGDGTRAVQLLRARVGKAYMSEIRALLTEMVHDAQATYHLQSEVSRVWLDRMLTLVVTIVACAIILGFYGTRALSRSAGRLGHSEAALKALNETLEERVDERTEQLNAALVSAARERDRIKSLIGETNHRIGNSLQLVSAYVNLQARRFDDPHIAGSLREVGARISAIAVAQRRLKLAEDLRTTDTQSFLEPVINDLRANLPDKGRVRVASEVEKISISSRHAVSLSVILLELVTNALKYAFPSDMRGLVGVKLGVVGDRVHLVVEDNGVGTAAEMVVSGTGSGIVDTLVRSFGGTVAREEACSDAGRPGTRVSVVLPLASLAA